MLAALLLAAAVSAAPAPGADPRLLAGLEHTLRAGDWNERVQATEDLGALGAAGLPGLRVAAEDADWQVRLTAVHLMGQIGAPAQADLTRVLREEPCRHVRLTALHWLGAIGPAASGSLRAALNDESAMVRMLGRYWLRKQGASGEEDEPSDDAAAAGEDLLVCAASPEPGRASWASPAPRAAAPAMPAAPPREAAPIVLNLRTPEPFARRAVAAAPAAAPLPRERRLALDALLEPETKAPESLPPGPPGLAQRPQPRAPEPTFESSPMPVAPPSASTPAPARGTPETLPAGALALGPRPVARAAELAIASDAPDAPPQFDALPPLLALLKDRDPRLRARAADELGALGSVSPAVVPALTRALKDRRRRVRASAALALGNLGAAADPSVPALVAALRRGPEEVSWSAALALGRVGTPRARRAFARYARKSAGEFLERQSAR